jgi:hypothetical protein
VALGDRASVRLPQHRVLKLAGCLLSSEPRFNGFVAASGGDNGGTPTVELSRQDRR